MITTPSTRIQVSIDLVFITDPYLARRLAALLFGNPGLGVTSIVGSST